ncbi:hypothetical protein FOZ63_031133 [Perkinsus olseni]|uniref:Uncharacterized protein n=2 Tax=Perkinsus olseni TaxID=32597 RepID=A0A7J6RIK6_PEROL|nr:hypothetical protein FOZ63_031133 [Perkinsus olseni]
MAKQTVITDSDEESDAEELLNRQYKVILLGNGAVGKTSLAHRFCDGSFSTSYKQTIGLDFFVKAGDTSDSPGRYQCMSSSVGYRRPEYREQDDQSVESRAQALNLCRDACQLKYIYGSDAVILVYDITSYQSFQDLNDWLQLVEGATGSLAAEAGMNPP